MLTLNNEEEFELISLLKRSVYWGQFSPAGYLCPCCHAAWRKYGHDEECDLKKWLDKLKIEV